MSVIQGGVTIEVSARSGVKRREGRGVVIVLLMISALFYAVGFVHLRADFPNGSPWMDMSKMTDEGWYGGGAIHHFVQGSWYLTDSFNPAVAMPVWPAMLGAWFAVTGVSMMAARSLTMLLYGISLVLLYRVAWRARPGRMAAMVVLLTVINPFCYAFNRQALLEPVTTFWMMVALWLAGETRREDAVRQVLLGVVILLLVLTKVTGVALAPAVLYMMWAGWGWPGWRGLGKRGVAGLTLVAGAAAVLWVAYMRLVVRPHFAADYELLFRINAYRVHLSIVPRMAWVTLKDAMWINPVLLVLGMVVFVISLVWLRTLWRVPLYGASVIAIVGHLAYIGYHTNFQPRYYEVIAMPLALVVGLGVAAIWDRREQPRARWGAVVLAVAMTVAAAGMGLHTMEYVLHPDYSFWVAAQGVAAIVNADGEAEGGTRAVLLSDSGDDISLWTGVPAICASYSVHGVDALLSRYRPRWYAAWPGWDDANISKMAQRYRMDEVAHYRVLDVPGRKVLALYKLTPR